MCEACELRQPGDGHTWVTVVEYRAVGRDNDEGGPHDDHASWRLERTEAEADAEGYRDMEVAFDEVFLQKRTARQRIERLS